MKNRAKIELLALRSVRTKGPGVLGLALLVAALSLATLTVRVAPAEAATFTVNTADDIDDGACTAGHCSFREAILAANSFPDTDTINFNIPGPAPHTIRHALGGHPKRLLFPVIIDGTSQPGYAGEPIIELDGSLSSPAMPGLGFYGGSSTVRGLVINRYTGSGIELQQRGNYRVEDNYIGTDLTGTLARGNGASGIFVFFRGPAHGLENGRNTIEHNVISGNGIHGIALAEDRNVVHDNHIGTDVSGELALGNADTGISINNSGSDNLIEGNVVSANDRWGIVNGGSCNPCTTPFARNVIQGNFIGTDASGTAALGNGLDGIRTFGNNTTIGGTVAGARNIISGNGWNGILIGGRSMGSVVQGNLIGTASDGTTALGNGLALSFNRDSGIDASFAIETTIGGTAPGAANTIAYSTGPGVLIGGSSNDPTFSRNGVLTNSIHSNGGLGIDLNPRGVKPNDAGDADRGPNELQNYPVLTSASGNTIAGTLNTLANTSFRLEFFANGEPDPSGHGEGERFLGATSVTTNGSGNASFSFVSPTSFSGQYLSATATDPVNNTSEFSGVLFVPGQVPSPSLTLSPPTATNDTGEEHCVTATARDGSGIAIVGVTVRFSVSGVNSASGSDTTDANGVAEFCYTGTNAGLDTIEAYVDTNGDSVQDDGEPADTAFKTYVAVVPPESPPYLLLIDESSIDDGSQPNSFSPTNVNDELASLALRTPLAAFDGANVGLTYTLHTGEVGDEGWFAPKTIPATWVAAGPTVDGVRNFVGNPREPYPHNVGPGLGTADANGDRESLLDKVPAVTPLRATALGLLAERRATLCAVVYDSGIGVNYGPLSGSLKGENLGTVAFRVLSSSPLLDHSTGSLPQVEVEVLDAGTVCEQELQLFSDAPEPRSSSEPYDTGRPATG
jgi:CSLREA domain-containing protein